MQQKFADNSVGIEFKTCRKLKLSIFNKKIYEQFLGKIVSSGKKFIISCNKLTILKVNHCEKKYCSFKISPFESYI